MEKKTQSRICNWSLLVLAILMLASGIQMEASFGADFLGISFPVYKGIVCDSLKLNCDTFTASAISWGVCFLVSILISSMP